MKQFKFLVIKKGDILYYRIVYDVAELVYDLTLDRNRIEIWRVNVPYLGFGYEIGIYLRGDYGCHNHVVGKTHIGNLDRLLFANKKINEYYEKSTV
jgi:hypothetical protein